MKLKILLTAIACAVVAGLAWSTRAMWLTSASDTQVAQATEASSDDGHAAVVVLSADKLESAKIKTAPAMLSVMQETRFVPGRVQYDDTRHVEVKAAADGVLVQVLVKPGDKVQAGQILATLSSPEIGQARADMLKRRADLAIATRSFDWQNEINSSVRQLIDALAKRPAMQEIETSFSRRTLGDYRTKLLTAYSRLRLAESQAASADTVATSGAVPSKVIRERLNERERAELEFVATSEQSKFDAQQARDAAEANVEDAQRRYEISQQHLATLLGYNETTMGDSVQQVVGTATEAASPPALLSIVESRAPISGTIERKTFGATERVKQGESLFVVADTSKLWIAADLREQEWSALKLKPNQELKVVSPALPNQTLTASVYYVGPEVTTDSNAVQLVARIDNSAELLRPGLFVRVEVPLSNGVEVLTVPTGAVVEHERSSFLFIEESVGHYRRRDVRIGRANLERVEITSGLEAGTTVVSEGAFVLKSELLLEREE